MVAMTLLPPIIPKYDWYMTGVSAVLLAVIIYVAVDRSQHKDDYKRLQKKHHTQHASDAMFVVVMSVLVLFVSGVFSYKPVVIMSNSMVPVFARGSVVVVQKVKNPLDIRIGDIIQYQADNKTITHRVIAITEDEGGNGGRVFVTKGDNNPSEDAPVSGEHVMGIIRSTVPYIGFPTVLLKELSARQ
jgi:signal peptidase